MPQDTTIVLDGAAKIDLPESLITSSQPPPPVDDNIAYGDQQESSPYLGGWEVFFLGSLTVIILFLIRTRTIPLPRIFSGLHISYNLRFFKNKYGEEHYDQLSFSTHIKYHNWLTNYNPYYCTLNMQQQERFLGRTITYMHSKKFIYHFIQEEEMMPVLISGAAVQLTFGLKNYLMDYFSEIHVISKEYHIPHDDDTYYGHVSLQGIHVAWDHFLDGYKDYTDSINVGLHEMAHAVSYDVFLGHEDMHDRKFKERLEEFSREGRPVFRAMRSGDNRLLDDYGATNFDEFWAVCVETFFENPASFKNDMPDLYREISELLNQDPLQSEKILDLSIA